MSKSINRENRGIHLKLSWSKFFPPLSSGAAEEDEILAAKMKLLSKQINSLKSFVEENNLERKSAKWEITEDIKDFPFLGEQELRKQDKINYILC
jgi:hypothetical protein